MIKMPGFFIYVRKVHVYIFTMTLYHNFTINSLRTSREINSRKISGYYPVNGLAKMQIPYLYEC